MMDENRQARVLAFQQSQTLSDRAKIAEIETAAAQAFYRTYGKRLTPMMVARGVETILISPESTVTIKGNLRQLPESSDLDGWDRLVKTTAKNDCWISANLISSDQQLKNELKDEFLSGASSAVKITLARAGQLDAAITEYVDLNIQARLEALR
jgi:hypothetical protein